MFGSSLRLLLVAALCLTRARVAAVPVESETEAETLEARAGTYPIVGATTGGIQPRYEIRTLLNDHPNQWNMYLLALQAFQAMPQNELLSWFQVGGIHGSPNIAWDGVQQRAPGVGYCTHSCNEFPTWHRPYLALFEQLVVKHAITIANQFPASSRATWVSAAKTLRIPFYDWAIAPPSGLPAFPDVITGRTLGVTTPTGKKTISNPLFRYGYHPLSNNDFTPYGTPFTGWPYTLRYPTSENSDASSQENLAESTIANNREGQKQNLYNWFTLCPKYLQASNDLPSSSSSSCHISLESLHNNIHVWIGGNNEGHMTVIPVSALEPTFMLHHAQIDRLFAMWQVVYPKQWMPPQKSAIDTFTINKGDLLKASSPLEPFHRDTKGTFWTSNAIRNTHIFSYTYPDLQIANGNSGAMRNRINTLYGPNSQAVAAGKAKRELPLGDAILTPPPQLLQATNGSAYEYIANIATTRFGLNQPYSVYVFLGNPTSEDPATWGTDSKLIGSVGVFSMSGMQDANLSTTSAVPLTTALTEQVGLGLLDSLVEEFVVPYLTTQLTWRVATSNLQVIDPADVPDFVLSVVGTTRSQITNPDDFPTYSEFNVLTNITHGKPGGLPFGAALDYLGQHFEEYLSDAADEIESIV